MSDLVKVDNPKITSLERLAALADQKRAVGFYGIVKPAAVVLHMQGALIAKMIESGRQDQDSGKNFDEQATAEHDLYNAMLKHKTEVVVAGTHISPDEAKSVLYEAYQLHLDDIEIATGD